MIIFTVLLVYFTPRNYTVVQGVRHGFKMGGGSFKIIKNSLIFSKYWGPRPPAPPVADAMLDRIDIIINYSDYSYFAHLHIQYLSRSFPFAIKMYSHINLLVYQYK